MLTASGQAAVLLAVLNLCKAGDHIISTSALYGGTYNTFKRTLPSMGIEVTFLEPGCPDESLEAAFCDNTRLVYGEMLSNPTLVVLDIGRLADAAHAHGVPLVVDNTFPTPILCRPFAFGADIVLHSTSKYMDGHARALGGVIVEKADPSPVGAFHWKNGKFPGLSEPDESYHGVVFADHFGNAAYIAKARLHLMRDLGPSPAPFNAFLLHMGLETLALRMERHVSNATQVAHWLERSPDVSWVNYPGLASSRKCTGDALSARRRQRRGLSWCRRRARGRHPVYGFLAAGRDRDPCRGYRTSVIHPAKHHPPAMARSACTQGVGADMIAFGGNENPDVSRRPFSGPHSRPDIGKRIIQDTGVHRAGFIVDRRASSVMERCIGLENPAKKAAKSMHLPGLQNRRCSGTPSA
jgi:hypothetical protein